MYPREVVALQKEYATFIIPPDRCIYIIYAFIKARNVKHYYSLWCTIVSRGQTAFSLLCWVGGKLFPPTQKGKKWSGHTRLGVQPLAFNTNFSRNLNVFLCKYFCHSAFSVFSWLKQIDIVCQILQNLLVLYNTVE